MHIHSIRLGHACNSSSSHSIIITKKNLDLHKHPLNSEYGWEDFFLSTKEEKLDYINAQINNNVDHQSAWSLPYNYNSNELNQEFIDDLTKYLLSENIKITGGNDNDDNFDDTYKFKSSKSLEKFRFPFTNNHNSHKFVAKKDYKSDIWTLFNLINGTKIKFSFSKDKPTTSLDIHTNNTNNTIVPETPDLIDLKITDYCNKECYFCYQGSTTKGIHAKTENIFKIINELSKLKVLEIAFGGGEPTSHPDFIEILNYTKERGIVPNFTTNSVDNITQEMVDFCGSIAVSVTNLRDVVKTLGNTYNDNDSSNSKICLNVVEGIFPEYNISALLSIVLEFNTRIVFLGSKIPKRNYAQKLNNFKKSTIEKILRETIYENISVDTLFVKHHANIIKNNIPTIFLPEEEGLSSMYIDSVKMSIQRNSYDKNNFEYFLEGIKINDAFKLIQKETLNNNI